MRPPLLITGVGRSGTTLVEKMLHSHPAICVGSQPFPDLFLQAVTAFLAERGVTRANPVGPRFPEADGTMEELADFLERDYWSAARLDALFETMADNSGQYMKPLLSARNAIRPGFFFNVYSQLLEAVARELGCEDADWIGSKETWFEELISFLLYRGGAGVLVLRDPRDVLTSFRYGRGRDFGGPVRPTLFILRQWRKSVAFALHLKTHPRFAVVRYEDIVARPVTALEEITHALGVEPFPNHAFSGVLRDQEGRKWDGNSSFGPMGGLSLDSVGRWKQHLDPATVRYVETVCGPELGCLGYPRHDRSNRPHGDPIGDFVEPAFVGHPRFRPDYSCNPEAMEVERRRLELLDGAPPHADLRKWFIFPEAYDLLRGEAGPPLFDALEKI